MKMQNGEVLTPTEQERINNLSTNPETAKAVFKNMNKVPYTTGNKTRY